MKKITFAATSVTVALLFSLTSSWVSADENDPPSSVARLSYAEGSVSIQPAGTQDWIQAPINRPLTTGDVVWSDQDSRSELQLDGSTVRIADSTELTILNLGNEITQLQLSSGTMVLRVRRLDDRETYEIDTPNLAFSVLRPGVYRLSVDSAGNTSVSVRSGQGEVSGGGSAYSIYAGNTDLFSGTDQLSAQALPDSVTPDSFDAWCGERDSRWEHSLSARYVSPDVIGYEDLDDQGSWRPSPEYGHVWYPNRVAAGWAPYHVGHWSYIAPWGYTWVDDQPWGFAPFHYGRWLWTDGGWGWIPSPPRPDRGPYIRPVYAPALVAWVGAGVGASVAWFALGPREVYVPSYPVSANYVRNINVSNTTVTNTVVNNVYNTTVINNKTVNVTYVNRGAPGGIAATSAQAFSTAQPVAKNRVQVDARALANAPTRSQVPFPIPTKQAILGSAATSGMRPPPSIAARPAVARTAPPAPQPSVERRLEAISNNGGKPLSMVQSRAIQPEKAAVPTVAIRIAPPAAPVAVTRETPRANVPALPAAAHEHPSAPAAPAPEMPISRPMPAAVHARELPAPPTPSSPGIAASALERQHLQQQQQLAAQQAQERQHVQQQQEREHQQAAQQQAAAVNKQAEERQRLATQAEAARNQAVEQQRQAKQQADAARNQELERQHQMQTQQLQQKHIEEQQQLQARQREQQKAQGAGHAGSPAHP